MNWNNLGYLDQIRMSQSNCRFKRIFHTLAQQNQKRALRYLNDEKLQFPSLFILLPEIETMDLYENLNLRNIISIKICMEIANNQNLASLSQNLSPQNKDATHQALKWMFQTGVCWDGPDEDYDAYDAVMDCVVALLTRIYEDAAILPAVVELIFRRHRNELFIHDLVWSFFQVLDPHALRLMANYLFSANRKDVELACKLLHLQLPDEMENGVTKQTLHRQYLQWLDGNLPFLYLTGEYFQLTSNPEPFQVALDAKYLYKKISPRSRKPLTPLTENEIRCLQEFREAPENEQKILSSYSYHMHEQDMGLWNEWMNRPLAEQLGTAKRDLEGIL